MKDTQIISDGDKGLENAIDKNFMNGQQFLCTWHRKVHIAKHRNTADKHLYITMARTNNMSEFNECKAKLSPNGSKYLAKTADARHYMLFCKKLKGCSTQSMSESLNAAGID